MRRRPQCVVLDPIVDDGEGSLQPAEEQPDLRLSAPNQAAAKERVELAQPVEDETR